MQTDEVILACVKYLNLPRRWEETFTKLIEFPKTGEQLIFISQMILNRMSSSLSTLSNTQAPVLASRRTCRHLKLTSFESEHRIFSRTLGLFQ